MTRRTRRLIDDALTAQRQQIADAIEQTRNEDPWATGYGLGKYDGLTIAADIARTWDGDPS